MSDSAVLLKHFNFAAAATNMYFKCMNNPKLEEQVQNLKNTDNFL